MTYQERLRAAQTEWRDAAEAYENAGAAWIAMDPVNFEHLSDLVVKALVSERFRDEYARLRAAARALESVQAELEVAAQASHSLAAMPGRGQLVPKVVWTMQDE